MESEWKKLKLANNQLPAYDAFMPYVLEALRSGKQVSKKTIYEEIQKLLQFPEDVWNIRFPDYPTGETILQNRIGFALSYLYKADALLRPRRGVYQITQTGLELLEKYGNDLDDKVIKQQPAYLKYQDELAERNQRISGNKTVSEQTVVTDLDIKQAVRSRNNEVAIELLDRIRKEEPSFFEKLVVLLLEKMGYSGEGGRASVTPKTNDGGIDGILNQDPLGTRTVYVQAKRYAEGNNVQRPEIHASIGALADVNADRGVFITTSDFSKGARESARSRGIVLVDGIELTALMLKFQVGVEAAEQFTLYKIDSDFFDDNN